MANPVTLQLTGVEVQLEVWRGTDNTWRATLTQANNQPLNLTNYDVTLTITNREGGTVQHTVTNVGPGGHENAAQGKTLVNAPASIYAALTEQRMYTWKYFIVSREKTTGAKHVHFFGDFRVLAPPSPV